MAWGISTDQVHLDPIVPASRQPNELDWPALLGWYGSNPPAFAGRNFLNGGWTWAHGEGAAALALAPSLTRVAPIQAPDPDRQQATGDDGHAFGDEDGAAFGDRLSTCVATDELTLPGPYAFVFLDVAAGTALSPDYWAGWANAVWNAQTVVGMGRIVVPFAPAILCDFFEAPPDNKLMPDPDVVAALDAVHRAYPGEDVQCYGFWARNLNQPMTPHPTLDWSLFGSYSQPFAPEKSEEVPVLIWRYSPLSSLTASQAGGNPVNLDASNDSPGAMSDIDRQLLQVSPAFTIDAGGGLQWGFDVGSSVASQATCIQTATLNAPSRGIANESVEMVGRYYDNFSAASPHHLSPAELSALRQAGMSVCVVWESPRPVPSGIYSTVPAYLTGGYGQQDGQDAFAKALAMGQPAHTPVYFSIDMDVPPANYPDLLTYFSDVAAGYRAYLQAQRNQDLEARPYAIGCYGGPRVLDVVYRQGIASYFWEAVAWNYGRGAWPHANLWQRTEQSTDGTTICGMGIDIDEAWGDPGTW
jgi:hypothetical protein